MLKLKGRAIELTHFNFDDLRSKKFWSSVSILSCFWCSYMLKDFTVFLGISYSHIHSSRLQFYFFRWIQQNWDTYFKAYQEDVVDIRITGFISCLRESAFLSIILSQTLVFDLSTRGHSVWAIISLLSLYYLTLDFFCFPFFSLGHSLSFVSEMFLPAKN